MSLDSETNATWRRKRRARTVRLDFKTCEKTLYRRRIANRRARKARRKNRG